MTTVTFDTLELVERLVKSGIDQKQAEAVVRVIADAQDNLISKADLAVFKGELHKEEFSPMKADLMLLKWMIGMLLAGVISLVLKAFF